MTSNYFQKMKQMETLIHTVRIYSQGIGMESGIEKWQTTSNRQNRTTKSRLERSQKTRPTNS